MNFSFLHNQPRYRYGVITGISQNLEFMLPFWWWNYQLHNQHPLLFLDFGMSLKGKNWCKQRGLVSDPIPSDFVKKKESLDPLLIEQWQKIILGDPLSARDEWFKKPLGLLHSPFATGLWIDLDCEILSSLDHIFQLVEDTQKIAIRKDTKNASANNSQEIVYNSGVVGFPFQSQIISHWAEKTYTKNEEFMGDQDILSRVLYEIPDSLSELLPQDNMYFREEWNEPRILHWLGYEGKIELIKKITHHPRTSFFDAQELMV